MAAATVQTVALGASVRVSASANASASSKPAVFGKGFMGQAVVQRASFPAKKATKVAAKAAVEVKLPLELEKNDANNLPLNTFSNKKPCIGKIVSVETIVGPKAPGETCHIIIDHGGQMPFVEGQSYGVIPPGDNPKKPGKPNTVRLYSIASTRYGDTDFNGKTTSLCVRRAEYFDPVTGQKDPAKKGICSNFLCDAKPGDEVVLTGPTGKVMLLPESPSATVIMLATGTGIAPYRAFIRRAFIERPPNYQFNGLMWLFLGVANTDSLLYEDDWQDILKKFPKNFRYDKALSREQKNAKGGKMYIQDKVEEYGEEVFKMLQDGAHIYFCGLKGMMPGIIDMMTAVAEKKGLNWTEFSEELKHKGQWHVEVY